jgi:hypothetical protein
MLPQDVRLVVANRDLQRSVAPQSPVRSLLDGLAPSLSSPGFRSQQANDHSGGSVGSLLRDSDEATIPEAFPVANTHEHQQPNQPLQLSVRLTRDLWVPFVYKGTSVATVHPSQGLTCGGQKVTEEVGVFLLLLFGS